jgi:hypothetical protein
LFAPPDSNQSSSGGNETAEASGVEGRKGDFQYKEDAEKVMEVLPKRFAKYGLTIHPEKTRLLEFGRYAEEKAKRQGKKPATFDFLGCTNPTIILGVSGYRRENGTTLPVSLR